MVLQSFTFHISYRPHAIALCRRNYSSCLLAMHFTKMITQLNRPHTHTRTNWNSNTKPDFDEIQLIKLLLGGKNSRSFDWKTSVDTKKQCKTPVLRASGVERETESHLAKYVWNPYPPSPCIHSCLLFMLLSDVWHSGTATAVNLFKEAAFGKRRLVVLALYLLAPKSRSACTLFLPVGRKQAGWVM